MFECILVAQTLYIPKYCSQNCDQQFSNAKSVREAGAQGQTKIAQIWNILQTILNKNNPHFLDHITILPYALKMFWLKFLAANLYEFVWSFSEFIFYPLFCYKQKIDFLISSVHLKEINFFRVNLLSSICITIFIILYTTYFRVIGEKSLLFQNFEWVKTISIYISIILN